MRPAGITAGLKFLQEEYAAFVFVKPSLDVEGLTNRFIVFA
jgi:hypothetical protein